MSQPNQVLRGRCHITGRDRRCCKHILLIQGQNIMVGSPTCVGAGIPELAKGHQWDGGVDVLHHKLAIIALTGSRARWEQRGGTCFDSNNPTLIRLGTAAIAGQAAHCQARPPHTP